MKLLKCLSAKDWLMIVLALFLIICQVNWDLEMPIYTGKLTTVVASGSVAMSDILFNGLMMLLYAVLSMAASIGCGYLGARVAANFSMRLRKSIFTKVMDFSSAEMNGFSTGELITRSTNDVVQVQNLIAMGLQVFIKAPIMAIYALQKVSTSHIEWTVVTVATVAVILVAIIVVMILCISKFAKIQKLTDNLNNVTREEVTGVRVIRAFNAEEYHAGKFESVNDKVTKNSIFTSCATGILMPLLQFAMNTLTLLIYIIGAVLMSNAEAADKAVLIGDMTVFMQYALQIVTAFVMLVVIFMILPRSIVSCKRINEVLNKEITVQDGTLKYGTAGLKGTVEFRNVSFTYDGGASPALSDISFKANQGETIAIIGSTGSGKSTLINLIPRFYDVTCGEIFVNGINVKDYTKHSLRRLIGIATQKAKLFQGDIAENISYGSGSGDMARALEISQSSEFVGKLQDKENAYVAQGGTNYSGGQKQRISIARAIYKNPEILIFDDSFSALDYKTDSIVRKQIREKAQDATVFIVAQRIGTIKDADKIIVLDEGKMVGIGTHRELLDTCSTYKEIALSQLSEEELK